MFGISARSSSEIRWTFCRYRNIIVCKILRVFVHSQMSINFSSFRNFAFLGEVGFFPYISCITCSTKTFPILSNLSSHGPGKYVKHGIYAALRTSSARLSLRTKIKLYQRYIERDFSWSMQNCIHDFKTKEMLHCFLFHLGNTLLKEGRYIIYFF